MIRQQATMTRAGVVGAAPYKLWVVLIVLGVPVLALVAYRANREIAQDVDFQVAQAENAFCAKLVHQQGAQYESCLQEVARLMRQEREMRSLEF